MRFQRIIEQVYNRPWFITAEGYSSVRRLVESRLARSESDMPDLSAFVNPRDAMEIDAQGIAHISICGVLGKGLTPIEQSCGNTSYEVIASEIAAAIGAGCMGIFFRINSPGGGVTGNGEIVDLVQSLQIPAVAYTDELCCSAAYNIAASCRAIYASQSATIGSIGTIIPWVDSSKQWAEEGIDFQPITNAEGDLKAAFHGPSLTPEQRADLEQYVQDAFEQFRGNVLRNRAVPASAMRGQAFFAARALENNLIDAICSEQVAYEALLKISR